MVLCCELKLDKTEIKQRNVIILRLIYSTVHNKQ